MPGHQLPPATPEDRAQEQKIRESFDSIAASVRSAVRSQHRLDRTMNAQLGPREQAFRYASRTTADHVAYMRKIAESSRPLLLLGECGSGRRTLAAMLHEMARMHGPMVIVDGSTIDEQGLALFGSDRRPADDRVQEAMNGLLVLTHPEALPMPVQRQLDALLTGMGYRRHGEPTPRFSQTRWVTIYDGNQEAWSSDPRLLRSLALRLSPHRLQVAALRERRADIAPIAVAAAQTIARECGLPPPVMSSDELERFLAMDWEDNINGLLRDVRAWVMSKAADAPAPAADEPPACVFGAKLPTLRACAEALIAEALRRSGGRQSQAAMLLGITPQSLSERLQRQRARRAEVHLDTDL